MIEFKILNKNLYTEEDLKPRTAGSAGIDLKFDYISSENKTVPIIHTGLAVYIKDTNLVGLVLARSSCPVILRNSVGVIDSDYQGELLLVPSIMDATVSYGTRIAQLIILPVMGVFLKKIVDEFSNETATIRGSGGFGSTGC